MRKEILHFWRISVSISLTSDIVEVMRHLSSQGQELKPFQLDSKFPLLHLLCSRLRSLSWNVFKLTAEAFQVSALMQWHDMVWFLGYTPWRSPQVLFQTFGMTICWLSFTFTWFRVFVRMSSLRLVCKLSTILLKEETPEMVLLYTSDTSCSQACSEVTIVLSYTIMESRLWPFQRQYKY